jgi:hypothetical protein
MMHDICESGWRTAEKRVRIFFAVRCAAIIFIPFPGSSGRGAPSERRVTTQPGNEWLALS